MKYRSRITLFRYIYRRLIYHAKNPLIQIYERCIIQPLGFYER